jgi:DNA-binding MarR family transcriptional regulator
MLLPPTPKQLAVEKFITAFSADHGYSPSVNELAESFGVTGASMQGILNRMVERGRITRAAGRARTIEVVRPVNG